MSVERRKSVRRFIRGPAILIAADGLVLGTCVLLDLSAAGAKLQPKLPSAVPNEFILVTLRDGQLQRQCSVVWRSGKALGVHFAAK
jgi:hypothetical protein